MATTVVHNRRDGFDVYIGRPTKWGNPFPLLYEADRDKVVEQYREWILQQPELLADLHELRGKKLGCWCAPKRCHGDVLAELADALCDTCDGQGWYTAAAHYDRCTGDCENHGCPQAVQERCPDCTQGGP